MDTRVADDATPQPSEVSDAPSTARSRKWGRIAVREVLLLATALLIGATVYKTTWFPETQFLELLFYAQHGWARGGATQAMATEIAQTAAVWLVVLHLPFLVPWRRLGRSLRARRTGWATRLATAMHRRATGIRRGYVALAFIVGLSVCLMAFQVPRYAWSLYDSSTIYEEHYVEPANAALTHVGTPRNLILIYLESVENTLASTAGGGQSEVSLIPDLERLALDPANVSFTHQAGRIGGAQQLSGTAWSLAGMVATQGGIPLKVSIYNDGGSLPEFLPGAWMLGDVLAARGYNQSIVMGADPSFGGVDKLLGLHGDVTILGPQYLKAQGRLPKGYHTWWGYEDAKMFQFAKEEATRLASLGEPFHLQMLTEDTHWPDGYNDTTCPRTHQRQYDNVYACSSARIASFIEWVQQQPFAPDTTIVLVGDHLGMQAGYYTGMVHDPGFVRTTYNLIVNPAVRPVSDRPRTFTSTDFYPTILTAMGYTVPGDRLGLGTNLFGTTPTLAEQLGMPALEAELSKRSSLYDSRLMTKPA